MSAIQIAGMVFFIVVILIAVGALGFSIYQSVNLVKDKRTTIDYKKYAKLIGGAGLLFVVSFVFSMLSIFIWNAYNATWQNWLQAIFGNLIFSCSVFIFINSFIIHYYKKNLPIKLDKWLFIAIISLIPIMVISFFLATDGYADMCGPNFLFPNGINFSEGFVRPDNPNKPNIAFYAICILGGAILVYFLSDHYMYKKYGKHGTLETSFFTAFPAGIIGARIAYVIGNWTKDGFDTRMAKGEWWSIFAIWEGGLTILGGAIAGIIVGVLVYIKTNKGRSIWTAIDYIVPTILIAQAIGRWGNFFNCEVHGIMMDEASWGWLPRIIFNNAHYSSTSGWADPGKLFVPLFFIEFLANLLGYYVIAFLFGKKFKNILAPGDLGASYIIWYGYTRAFMEPLRDSSYNMGQDGYWSWFWSLFFVGGGALLIMVNHIVRFILKYKKGQLSNAFSLKTYICGLICTASVGIALTSVGISLMAANPNSLTISFSNFNIGIILLVSGVSVLFMTAAIVVEYVYKFKKPTEVANA